MKMRRIDHVVLTVTDLEQSMRFYHEVFDMPVIKEQSNDDLITMRCGHQLIRLQKIDRPTTLKAANPTIGSADLCLVVPVVSVPIFDGGVRAETGDTVER